MITYSLPGHSTSTAENVYKLNGLVGNDTTYTVHVSTADYTISDYAILSSTITWHDTSGFTTAPCKEGNLIFTSYSINENSITLSAPNITVTDVFSYSPIGETTTGQAVGQIFTAQAGMKEWVTTLHNTGYYASYYASGIPLKLATTYWSVTSLIKNGELGYILSASNLSTTISTTSLFASFYESGTYYDSIGKTSTTYYGNARGLYTFKDTYTATITTAYSLTSEWEEYFISSRVNATNIMSVLTTVQNFDSNYNWRNITAYTATTNTTTLVQVGDTLYSESRHGTVFTGTAMKFLLDKGASVTTLSTLQALNSVEENYMTISTGQTNTSSTYGTFFLMDFARNKYSSTIAGYRWFTESTFISSSFSLTYSKSTEPNGTLYKFFNTRVSVIDNRCVYDSKTTTSTQFLANSSTSFTDTYLIDSSESVKISSHEFTTSVDLWSVSYSKSYSYWIGNSNGSNSISTTISYYGTSGMWVTFFSTIYDWNTAQTLNSPYYSYETSVLGWYNKAIGSESTTFSRWTDKAVKTTFTSSDFSQITSENSTTLSVKRYTIDSSFFGNTEIENSTFTWPARIETYISFRYMSTGSGYQEYINSSSRDYGFYMVSESSFYTVSYSNTSTFINNVLESSEISTSEASSYLSTSVYNTSEYGKTARFSTLLQSESFYSINTLGKKFSYNVDSVWKYNNFSSTLSNYTTVLSTTFSLGYNNTSTETRTESYSLFSSTAVNTINDRFIISNGITNYSTINVNITDEIALYDGTPLATISSTSETYIGSTSVDTSIIRYTFISSSADFTSSESVVGTFTTSNVREQFNNSLSIVISSTMEQQNDTLVFKSEIVTFSTYNTSATHSTISTLEVNYEATTYTEEYNPVSYTVSSTIQSTSLIAGTTLRSTSESVVYTQSIEYTPVYTTVDGIYMTTN